MKNLNYRSAWYSPRGFANEGNYLYGGAKDMDNFFKSSVAGDANCGYGSVKNHKSLVNAAMRANKDASSDYNRRRSSAEISCVGAINVNDMFA